MSANDQIYGVLKEFWGYDSFRNGQLEIICNALDGRDTLGIMPTGGGKSICFQVPALVKEGLCIVVTPLIALMKDQVHTLQKRGIKALAIHAGMSRREVDTALNNAAYGDYKFLYLSPERLGTELLRSYLPVLEVNFIVVDEAHCISQWGYDFRPDYLQIARLREIIDAPVLALTATATPKVAVDIMDKLLFEVPNIIKTSFERPNLAYICCETADKRGRILHTCLCESGSGIVYVRSRKTTEELSAFLQSRQVSASFYHAGLASTERSRRQQEWLDGKIRVMVCTNAFGMGIDKPDVRFVLHFGLPESIESYFQEAGRAGRDLKPSKAILFWNRDDCKRLHQLHTCSFPSLEYIEGIYHKIHAYFGIPYENGIGRQLRLDINDFCTRFKLNRVQAYYAIKYLDRCGHWTYDEQIDIPTKVMISAERNELYDIELQNEEEKNILDALMRRYEGIFSYTVPVDEESLSGRCGISVSRLRQNLYNLSVRHIIRYVPCTISDVLILKADRLYPKNVNLKPELYNMLVSTSKERTESIIGFVTDNSQCRSRILLRYFGQEKSDSCGKCDICAGYGEDSPRCKVDSGEISPIII